jgi:hypothetical protein
LLLLLLLLPLLLPLLRLRLLLVGAAAQCAAAASNKREPSVGRGTCGLRLQGILVVQYTTRSSRTIDCEESPAQMAGCCSAGRDI